MASYRPDHEGVGELMRTDEMRATLTAIATEAVPFAKAISPDAPPYGEGYISSFEVQEGGTAMIAGTRRAVTGIVNQSEHALLVELGVGQNMGHHVLARTADHIERNL